MLTGIVFLALSVAVGVGAWWYVRVLDARLAAGRSGRRKSSPQGAGGEGSGPLRVSGDKSLSVQEIWGVQDIMSGLIVLGDGWYSALLKIGPIDYHIMNEDEQYSIESVLMSCAMALNTRIQLFSTTELVDTKSCALEIRSFVESGDLSEAMAGYGSSMHAYLTSMMQNRSVHNRPRYISISYHTLDGFDDAWSELQRRAYTLIASLSRAKITAGLLSSEQVLDVLFRFHNRGRVLKPSEAVGGGALDLYVTGRGGVQSGVPLFKKSYSRQPDGGNRSLTDNVVDVKALISPDGVECRPDYLRVGPSRFCRVYVLYVYPRLISIGWLDDVFMIGDIDISIHIDPVPDRFVIRKLTEIVSSCRAQHGVLSKQGNILMLPDLENAIADNEVVREAIQTNRDKMFYVSVFIAVHADSEEELNKRCDSVEDALARKAARAYALMFRQLDGLRSCLPGGLSRIGDFTRNLTTGGVAAMFPVSNPDVSHPSGIYLGPSYFTGSPVVYDQFIGPPALPNPHVAVFGYSGSGKSVTLKTMIARSALTGERIVILDLMGEYEPLVRDLLNGKVVHVAAGRESGINPLEIEAETDESGQQAVDLHEKVAEVRALFTVISRAFNGSPLQAQDAAIIEEALREEYSERGITSDPRSLYTKAPGAVGPVKKRAPTLSDLYRRLTQKPVSTELKEVLKPFLRGNSLGIFDCETGLTLSDQVVSFDFSEIRDEFTKLYAEFGVLAWVRQKFVQQNRRLKKKFVVDEGWHFIKFPESAVALETVARTGRKANCGLVVASQFIEEFLTREEGRAVIGNCATLFLLRQHDTVIDQVVDAFHLSSGTKNLLGGFAPGECLMSLSGAVTAVRIEPTPFEWPYMQTNPNLQ